MPTSRRRERFRLISEANHHPPSMAIDGHTGVRYRGFPTPKTLKATTPALACAGAPTGVSVGVSPPQPAMMKGSSAHKTDSLLIRSPIRIFSPFIAIRSRGGRRLPHVGAIVSKLIASTSNKFRAADLRFNLDVGGGADTGI